MNFAIAKKKKPNNNVLLGKLKNARKALEFALDLSDSKHLYRDLEHLIVQAQLKLSEVSREHIGTLGIFAHIEFGGSSRPLIRRALGVCQQLILRLKIRCYLAPVAINS